MSVAHNVAMAMSPEQLMGGISDALLRGDVEAAGYYLLALTIIDPQRAATVERALRPGDDTITDRGRRV